MGPKFNLQWAANVIFSGPLIQSAWIPCRVYNGAPNIVCEGPFHQSAVGLCCTLNWATVFVLEVRACFPASVSALLKALILLAGLVLDIVFCSRMKAKPTLLFLVAGIICLTKYKLLQLHQKTPCIYFSFDVS